MATYLLESDDGTLIYYPTRIEGERMASARDGLLMNSQLLTCSHQPTIGETDQGFHIRVLASFQLNNDTISLTGLLEKWFYLRSERTLSP